MPVVMHRRPPRFTRHPRPLFCDSALHFNPTNRRQRRGRVMRRREMLKTGLAAAASFAAPLAAPHLARAAKASTLTFVPTSDLAVLDPIVTFNRPTRNYAYLFFDTLYGLDTNWQAQPQMVEGHEVDDDGLTWNLRLREGLRFSRQGAGFGARRRRQHPAFCAAYRFRDRADGGDRGIVSARRPHREVPPEAALPASAGG